MCVQVDFIRPPWFCISYVGVDGIGHAQVSFLNFRSGQSKFCICEMYQTVKKTTMGLVRLSWCTAVHVVLMSQSTQLT